MPDRPAPRLTPRDRQLLGLGLALLFLGVVAMLSHAPRSVVRVEGDRLFLSGTIVSRTPRQFDRALERHDGVRIVEQTLVWGSVDGDALDRVGRRVREAGLNTYLGPGAEVYSGGSQLFLAGVERSMAADAIIGVHAWVDRWGAATDYPRTSDWHDPDRSYVEDMLGSDAFYWFSINAAPPDDIHILTAEEIARFGLLTEPAAPDAPAR